MAAGRTPWEDIERWFRSARNRVEVLPADAERRAIIVHDLGIDADSTVAHVAMNIGGAFIDYGWFRLLGSGHPRMTLGLDVWNGARDRLEPWRSGAVFVVAHDVVGGFFALDSGALGFGRGHVAYLAPDAIAWEDLDLGFSGFLEWLADGDVAGFAEGNRWPGWEHEIHKLSGDDGIFVAPPLWAEGPPIGERLRAQVPMKELWTYAHTTMRQLEGVPAGSPVSFSAMEPPAPRGEEHSPDG